MEPKKEYPTFEEVVKWAIDKFPGGLVYYTPGPVSSHLFHKFIAPLIDRCKAAENRVFSYDAGGGYMRSMTAPHVEKEFAALMEARRGDDKLISTLMSERDAAWASATEAGREIDRLEKLVAELSAKITAAQEALDPEEAEDDEFDDPAFVRFGKAIGEALTAGKVNPAPLPWWQSRTTEPPKPKLYNVTCNWDGRSERSICGYFGSTAASWPHPFEPYTNPRPLHEAVKPVADLAADDKRYTNIRIEEAN